MTKLFQIISWLAIIPSLIIILTIFYWLNYPYKILKFNQDKFQIVNKTVKRGEMVYYKADICKYLDLPAVVSRSFMNEVIYLTPSFVSKRKVGCFCNTIAVVIPKELPPGRYYLKTMYKYKVNPIREVTYTHDTEEFEVAATRSANL